MPGLTLEDIDHKEVTGMLKKSPKINSKKCKFPKKHANGTQLLPS